MAAPCTGFGDGDKRAAEAPPALPRVKVELWDEALLGVCCRLVPSCSLNDELFDPRLGSAQIGP
eukprot:SAG11_NODE_1075_length_5967_cov_7.848841_3_plen_64_part_00